MIVSNEIASITILASFHRGKELINQIIPFKIFKDQDRYLSIPLISDEERILIGYSKEISFGFINEKIVPTPGLNTEDLQAVNNIVRELKMLRIA